MTHRNFPSRRYRRPHRAFTVLEVMVALGILAILLVIIVLPLRLGFDTFNAGNARSLTQSSLDSTMTQFETDLRQAVYVFPNAPILGVTDKEPYTTATNLTGLPYYLSTNANNTGEPGGGTIGNPNGIACLISAKLWSNTSTISMVQVRRDKSGQVITPLAPSYNIVTYYARRPQLDRPYDPIDNPVVMYRAEYPAFAENNAGTPLPLEVQSPAGALNAKLDFRRVTSADTACSTAPAVAVGNRSSLWLSHNVYGEADLLPLTKVGSAAQANTFTPVNGYNATPQNYSHTLAIPRGLALQASNGYRIAKGTFSPVDTTQPDAPLVPDTTFICTDTNRDGKIDRVTISLGLASFAVGAQGELDPNTNQPKGTVLRATRAVDLPNIR